MPQIGLRLITPSLSTQILSLRTVDIHVFPDRQCVAATFPLDGQSYGNGLLHRDDAY